MTETRYKVVFRGEIQQEKTIEQVKIQLAQITKQSPEKIELLFSGKPITVLKEADEVTAKRYQTAFHKAGAICYVRAITAPNTVVTPDAIPPKNPTPKKIPSSRAVVKKVPATTSEDIFNTAEESPRKKGSVVFISIILLVILVAGAFFATPYLTVWNMKKAYSARDAATLNSYVDFPTLRLNLKSQLSALIDKEIKGTPVNSGASPREAAQAATSFAMAKPLLEPLIDQFIVPETVEKLLAEKVPEKEAQSLNSSMEKIKLSYDGISSFLVTTEVEGKAITVVFARVDVINWHVVDVRLPTDGIDLPTEMGTPSVNAEEEVPAEPVAEPVSPTESEIKPNAYGALAYSTTSGMHGLSSQKSSQAEAEQEANNRCNSLTAKKDCQVLSMINNACIALAKASDATIFGWAWNNTQLEAEERAMRDCQERSVDCRLQQSFCSK
ncbi:DUF2939 domain-containing protein [Beggiatoa leptomitoformis]|uniref:DUF2939 domain-containing protein n=1 Tax=Beggiatoa leptomitoformis TaxID=288004 RepID=A0A2N9YHM2_9GAMM|nr:DUF4189 domain-containing protein [Beggiatoa leptomitoformis]ALG67789.1 DUF2939 domain-containing protein [Beggiatoa leptomitoformis]AUI69963.1 DUF2939 domain-containing protein [Beggiatoa leptomitoformis]